MKKLFFILIVFASFANVTAQIDINSSGHVGIGTANSGYQLDVAGDARVNGNILLGGAFNNFSTSHESLPITFKMNNVVAGYTGHIWHSSVSFGYGALNPLTGLGNTAIGFEALCSNTTSVSNTASGFRALYSNTTGNYNTATGSEALRSNTTGEGNTANGYRAIYLNTTGCKNTATGIYAMGSNTTGSNNTASGNYVLFSNSEGNNNTATGFNALYFNTTGSNNTAIGHSALNSNTSGNYNAAVGNNALHYNYSGCNNTAVGYYTLISNMTGSYNTAIGYSADVYTGSLTNATAIGYDTKVYASDQVRIGNSSVTSIGGYVAWTNFSDGRAKKNIRTEVPGLAFIKLLQPITYNLDLDALDALLKYDDPNINNTNDPLRIEPTPEEKAIVAKARAKKEQQVYSGFVAQDVEKAALSVGYDFSGVDAPENEKSVYGLRYSEFVVPLVKAVQELSEQNDAKDAAITLLQKQVNELTGLVNRLLGKE